MNKIDKIVKKFAKSFNDEEMSRFIDDSLSKSSLDNWLGKLNKQKVVASYDIEIQRDMLESTLDVIMFGNC